MMPRKWRPSPGHRHCIATEEIAMRLRFDQGDVALIGKIQTLEDFVLLPGIQDNTTASSSEDGVS